MITPEELEQKYVEQEEKKAGVTQSDDGKNR